MEKKISIIVPVYNAENTLVQCVDSIINQTYQNWELWLIDDGSKDDSGKICDKYSSSDMRIHTVHKLNAGVSAARNTGLENATGEYVLFVDSDDYIETNTLEMTMNKAVDSGADAVTFGFYYHFKEDNKVVANSIDKEFIGGNKEFVTEGFLELFRKELLNPPWNKLMKRELLLQNGIRFATEYSICEDMIFTISVLDACDKIAFIEAPLYHYIYKKEDNLVNKFHSNYFEALSFYVEKVKKYLSKYENATRTLVEIGAFYVNQSVAYLKKIYGASDYQEEMKYTELQRICETQGLRDELKSYVPKGIKKKVVISCMKHKRYRVLHLFYSKIVCRKQC